MLFRRTTFPPGTKSTRRGGKGALALALVLTAALTAGAAPTTQLHGFVDRGPDATARTILPVSSTSTNVFDFDFGCTKDWPYRQSVFSNDPVEERHNVQVALCATYPEGGIVEVWDETVWINTSPAVWWFDGGESSDFAIQDDDSRSRLFRSTVVRPYVYLAPGETISYPGAAGTIQWHIDNALTATWLAHDILKTTIKSAAIGGLSKALKTKSNKALKSCTLAYLGAIDAAGEFGDSESVDKILGSIGVAAGATTCSRDWRKAEKAIEKFPTLADDMAEAGKVATNVSKARQLWGWVQSGCTLIPKFPC